jgi:hypothetical protein
VGSLELDLGGGDVIHFNGFNTDAPLSTPNRTIRDAMARRSNGVWILTEGA